MFYWLFEKNLSKVWYVKERLIENEVFLDYINRIDNIEI